MKGYLIVGFVLTVIAIYLLGARLLCWWSARRECPAHHGHSVQDAPKSQLCRKHRLQRERIEYMERNLDR